MYRCLPVATNFNPLECSSQQVGSDCVAMANIRKNVGRKIGKYATIEKNKNEWKTNEKKKWIQWKIEPSVRWNFSWTTYDYHQVKLGESLLFADIAAFYLSHTLWWVLFARTISIRWQGKCFEMFGNVRTCIWHFLAVCTWLFARGFGTL